MGHGGTLELAVGNMLAPVFPVHGVWAVAGGGLLHDYLVDVADTSNDIKCDGGAPPITLADTVTDDDHSDHVG